MSSPRPRSLGVDTPLERVTLDIPRDESDLLDSYALYKNARAKALGIKVKALSRKSYAESIITEHLDALRRDIAEMIEAVGPLPREADFESRDELRAAMEKYARRVLAWDKKNDER